MGSTRGAIDPCFPAKIGIAHVHNLIAIKGARKQFNVIFFPMFDVLSSPLVKLTGSNACPTVTATPETVKAAYTKENNVFAEHGIGIVMLGRPYHHDPGLNHEILEEFQKLGYPIFSQNTLPLDEDLLDRLFGEEVRAGVISHPLEITDVWKQSYSCSTNHKVWAAKFTARHPNLVALEMSSFKCGHDAPIYGVIEGIIERSGTPYFCFKDLDENKPSGSIRIRVETIDYFLRRYREDIIRRRVSEQMIEEQLAEYERELRAVQGPRPSEAEVGLIHR